MRHLRPAPLWKMRQTAFVILWPCRQRLFRCKRVTSFAWCRRSAIVALGERCVRAARARAIWPIPECKIGSPHHAIAQFQIQVQLANGTEFFGDPAVVGVFLGDGSALRESTDFALDNSTLILDVFAPLAAADEDRNLGTGENVLVIVLEVVVLEAFEYVGSADALTEQLSATLVRYAAQPVADTPNFVSLHTDGLNPLECIGNPVLSFQGVDPEIAQTVATSDPCTDEGSVLAIGEEVCVESTLELPAGILRDVTYRANLVGPVEPAFLMSMTVTAVPMGAGSSVEQGQVRLPRVQVCRRVLTHC